MSSPKKKYVCKCFYQKNFYLQDLDKHVEYTDDDQFKQDYGPIHEELKRRKKLGEEVITRQSFIKKNYKKLHPDIYILQKNFLDPQFLKLIDKCKEKGLNKQDILPLLNICSEDARIYSFPIFNQEFCKKFIEEIENFEKSDVPKTRPNSMNKYGISLLELGFEDFLHPLRIQFMVPLCKILYPDWGGDFLDSEKAFVVKYKVGQDVGLGYHYDNSEITYNVSLNDDFQGGELYFGEMRNETLVNDDYVRFKHKKSHCVLHRGQQRHGAEPIKSGKRYNLIVWMRSSSIRNLECPMCESKPNLIETVGYGDGYVMN